MKKTMALLATATLVVVGCDRQDSSMDESAGAAKDQIEQAADAQKDALSQQKKEIEQSTDQAQDQISAQAKAEKERLESQASAEKAQIDAQQKQIDAQAAAAKADTEAQAKQASAQAEAAKADADAQAKQVNAQADANQAGVEAQVKVDEAAGAANVTAQGTTEADRTLNTQIKESLMSQNPTFADSGVTIMVKDGKVTLNGSVKTEDEKKNLEEQAKAVSGVTSVDNKLEVK